MGDSYLLSIGNGLLLVLMGDSYLLSIGNGLLLVLKKIIIK